MYFTEEELLKELEEAREARRDAERQREDLVKHAKQMQAKTQNRRNHGRLAACCCSVLFFSLSVFFRKRSQTL